MDVGTIVGFIGGLAFVIVSILMAVNYDAAAMARSFVNGPSVMITIGGTISAALIANPLPRVAAAVKAVAKIIVPAKLELKAAIERVILLSTLVRREGVLALEDAVAYDEPFLKKGVMLVVDAADPQLVRHVLETEAAYEQRRHGEVIGVWEFIAAAGPAWGMIGTLIGLIVMLQDMSDPDSIGPALAVAIITTFYGSVLANFIANPIASKLRVYSAEEALLKEVLIEGLLSIQAGENPRLIEERLKAFLAPALRGGRADDYAETLPLPAEDDFEL